MSKKAIIAYIPVLHAGYKKFFKENSDYKNLYIIGPEIIKTFRPIQKDVRALDQNSTKSAVSAWKIFETIEIIDHEDLKQIDKLSTHIIMPDEDISHELVEKYLRKSKVIFSPIFLRWDRKSSNAKDPVLANVTISKDALDKEFLSAAYKESQKSADIWRRIGAVIATKGKIIASAHNQATPNLYSSSILGDPRNNYSKGVAIEKSIFIHSEAKLIAEAAKNGMKLKGLDMYVTTFPCPVCAKLIAFSGIKRLFFSEGYTVLDGEALLKAYGVELIKVDMKPPKDTSISLPYPEK